VTAHSTSVSTKTAVAGDSWLFWCSPSVHVFTFFLFLLSLSLSLLLSPSSVYGVSNSRDLYLHFLSVMHFLAVSRICFINVSRMTMSSVTWQAVASWCIRCSMLNACRHITSVARCFKLHVNQVTLVPYLTRVLIRRFFKRNEMHTMRWMRGFNLKDRYGA